jgi:hypothetical protein
VRGGVHRNNNIVLVLYGVGGDTYLSQQIALLTKQPDDTFLEWQCRHGLFLLGESLDTSYIYSQVSID